LVENIKHICSIAHVGIFFSILREILSIPVEFVDLDVFMAITVSSNEIGSKSGWLLNME
jgi:hypothetical protein